MGRLTARPRLPWMIDGTVPWRMHEAGQQRFQDWGAAPFRYRNTPLSCSEEQNVRDVVRLSVKQADGKMEKVTEMVGS